MQARARGLAQKVWVVWDGGWFRAFICLSTEVSWKEELKEKCKTEVSKYEPVGSTRQVLGSSWWQAAQINTWINSLLPVWPLQTDPVTILRVGFQRAGSACDLQPPDRTRGPLLVRGVLAKTLSALPGSNYLLSLCLHAVHNRGLTMFPSKLLDLNRRTLQGED